MNPNEKEIYDLVKENNHMLKGMRRANRWSSILRVIYWILIIVTAFVAYNFIQPYLNTALKSYQNLQGSINSVKSVVNKIPTSITNIIK